MEVPGEQEFAEDTSDQDALSNPDFTKAKTLGMLVIRKSLCKGSKMFPPSSLSWSMLELAGAVG